MSKRDDYQKMMEEHLALWRARLEAFTAKASTAAKAELHEQLEKWKAAGDVAIGKLTELRATTGDAWDVTKAEMEKIWHTIEGSLETVEAGRRAQEDKAAAQAAKPATSSPPVAASASTPVVASGDSAKPA